MRVLVAPDKFRGTLTAPEAAAAIAAGWRRGDPDARVDVIPIADGGEGTLDAMVASLGGERRSATVSGPLGEPVDAEYGVAAAPEGTLGIVEMARASGLALVSSERRDPRAATTRGTGELILAACRASARRVMVCIGGSATNDAGAGMACAVGFALLDDEGRDLPEGGAALARLSRIDARGLDPSIRGVEFVVACDVDNPLVGPNGASAVYGPQKGASPEDVAVLDAALDRFADIARRDLRADIRDLPGAGAAGGLGAGLVAFLGAKLRPGVEVVMQAVGLRDRMSGADLAITGEGRFDGQSLRGKAPAGVLRVAAELGVPALVLCGQATTDAPGATVISLADRFGLEAAMARPAHLLEDLAAEIAAGYGTRRPPTGGRR